MLFQEIRNISRLFFYILKALLSSQKIYYDIVKNYRGYGIRFTAIVILLTTLISVIGFSINLKLLESNLAKPYSTEFSNLDYIISQFPENINYDGNSISFKEDEKIIEIKNPKNIVIMSFDLKNKMKNSEKAKIPIQFKKNEVLFPNLGYINSIKYNNLSIERGISISNMDIKNYIDHSLKTVKENVIFSIPIVFIIKFIDYILENILLIGFLYFICKLLKIDLLLKDIVRVTLFACAPSAIFESILLFTTPDLLFLSSLLKIFCLFLMYKAIGKIKAKRRDPF